MNRLKRKTSMATRVGIVLVVAFMLLCTMPLIYMVLMSLTQSDSPYFKLSDISFDFANYKTILIRNNYTQAILNSAIVAVLACLWTCFISALAGYGFEKKPIPHKELIYKILLATMMIPSQVTLIPLFLIMREINWLNTYAALVIPMAGAFGVMMMRSFMKSVPDVLIEAAQIDGCSEFFIFFKVVLPLVRPATISLTIFTFVATWNSFIWPLVVTNERSRYTLPVALSLLATNFEKNHGLVMAGSTITFLVPFILYCFLQKQFVAGIALGGVKE